MKLLFSQYFAVWIPTFPSSTFHASTMLPFIFIFLMKAMSSSANIEDLTGVQNQMKIHVAPHVAGMESPRASRDLRINQASMEGTKSVDRVLPHVGPEKYFLDVYSLETGPKQLEFGHVLEDPNEWEQRYEKKDHENNRFQGKVRWGDKEGSYGEHYYDFNHA